MSVDLPEPDVPATATNSPRAMVSETLRERVDRAALRRRVPFGDLFELDHDEPCG